MEDYSIQMAAAVTTNNIDNLRELLEMGADPNQKSLMSVAVKNKQVEIIKLLVQHGSEISFGLMSYVSQSENKELLVYILEYNPNNIKFAQKFFCRLVLGLEKRNHPEMFRVLLDYGLPVNGIIDDTYTYIYADIYKYDIRLDYENQYGTMTPLHLSVVEHHPDFVSLLLERGADANEKTSKGVSTLALATKTYADPEIFEMLLKRRDVDVNEKTIYKGGTVLHVFFEVFNCFATVGRLYDLHILSLLLAHGADPNILDDRGMTPFRCSGFTHADLMIKELAKLDFDGKPICRSNSEFLSKISRFQELFDSCKEELVRMKNNKFYNNFSLYDIFKMQKQEKRLLFLTKNKDFVTAMQSCWDYQSFPHYGAELCCFLKKVLVKSDTMKTEEIKLRLIFKNFLPELVIRNVAYFAMEECCNYPNVVSRS